MTRLELGQAAYSAGMQREDVRVGLIRWAASVYREAPPWWPELAPLNRDERDTVWKQLAFEAALTATRQDRERA